MEYIQPVLPGLVLLLAVSVAVLWRWRRVARVTVAMALVVLFLWSWPPTVVLTYETLESGYSPGLPERDDAEAIVVLTAGILRSHSSRPYSLPDFQSYVRSRYAAWLHNNWKPLPVLVTGGGGNPSQYESGEVVAQVMAHIVRSEGVPADLVWVEDRSFSTHQSARNCARLLREKGINRVALVTEAHHMLRAELSFRKAGLEVVPAPCEFRDIIDEWEMFIPTARAIEYNERILHEWLGLAYYRLRGYI